MTGGRPVLLVRPDGNERDARGLATLGVATRTDPYLTVAPLDDPAVSGTLAARLAALAHDDWLVLSSPRTLPAWRSLDSGVVERLAVATGRGVRLAAVGARTAQTLPVPVALVADGSGAAGMLAALRDVAGSPTALLPGSLRAARTLADGLIARGWAVTAVPVYTTVVVPVRPPSADGLSAGEYAAVLLRSPSAVEAVARFATPPAGTLVLAVGATTAAAARDRWSFVEELPAGDSRTLPHIAARLARTREEPVR